MKLKIIYLSHILELARFVAELIGIVIFFN